jgi:hypothetical protein
MLLIISYLLIINNYNSKVDNDSLNRQIKSKQEEEKVNMTEKSTTSTFDFQKKFIETKNIAMVSFCLFISLLNADVVLV